MHVELSSDYQHVVISTRPGVAAVITRAALKDAISGFVGTEEDRQAVVSGMMQRLVGGAGPSARTNPGEPIRETAASQPSPLDIERAVIDVLDRIHAGTINGAAQVPGQGIPASDETWRNP